MRCVKPGCRDGKNGRSRCLQYGLSLHAMPEMVLRRDFEDAHSTLASALLWRVDKGEFEATDEELDASNEQMMTSGMILALAQKFNTPRA
jgi:hypothetical protein